jgi:hypothetical protein
MIATTIVSVILVLVTAVLIGIGNLFYKGNSQAITQDTARSITNDISQQLQLNSGPIASSVSTVGGTVYAYCTSTYRYSFIENQEIGTGTGQVQHVLWRDPLPAGGCIAIPYSEMNSPIPASSTTGGTELMPPNTRLTCLDINNSCAAPNGPVGSPFILTVGVAYGDPTLTTGSDVNTTCQGLSGDQFCATANLSTTVLQRLQ